MASRAPFLLLFTSFYLVQAQQQIMASALASQYGLATSTIFPFPTATLSSNDATNHLVSQWSLGKGHIQDGTSNVAFVADPFPNSSPLGDPGSTPTSSGNFSVLQITYPQGSFSHDTGGTQFYNLWNTTDGSSFGSMLLSYEIAFDSSFDWVKGGKLPGLRGGLDGTGCSGGDSAPNGKDCFSSRVMWRKFAEGEGTLQYSISATLDANHLTLQSTLTSLHPMTSARIRTSPAIVILESASKEEPLVS